MNTTEDIRLAGVIGTVKSAWIEALHKQMVRFSLASNRILKDADSSDGKVIETTWHTCVYSTDKESADNLGLRSGMEVNLQGRIQEDRYADSQGFVRSVPTVIVENIKVVNTNSFYR